MKIHMFKVAAVTALVLVVSSGFAMRKELPKFNIPAGILQKGGVSLEEILNIQKYIVSNNLPELKAITEGDSARPWMGNDNIPQSVYAAALDFAQQVGANENIIKYLILKSTEDREKILREKEKKANEQLKPNTALWDMVRKLQEERGIKPGTNW